MTALSDVLGYFQTAGGSVSGVNYAPDEPPEKASQFPFWVVYPGRFVGQSGPVGSMTMLYDIVCEMHVARKGNLPTEFNTLLTFPETIAETLFETCNTYLLANDGIEGSFGPLEWGDIETLGFTWVIRAVKIITDFT